MEQSILISTKKILGLADDYTAFDLDVITHINATLVVLNQFGVGPAVFTPIEDSTVQWSALSLPADQLGMVKSYLYLKVRMLFDPPAVGFLKDAMENQIEEFEFRLGLMRDHLLPMPDPPPSLRTCPEGW